MDEIKNLNLLKICYIDETRRNPVECGLEDYSSEEAIFKDSGISVYFKNIEQIIVDKIKDADVVVGCVAWMTSYPILTALKEKDGVSIILQKEDFLRPDTDHKSSDVGLLKNLYASVKPVLINSCEFAIQLKGISAFSQNGERNYFGFRCVGNLKRNDTNAMPRMHHKFMVFCKKQKIVKSIDYYNSDLHYLPYAVWTGSYNMTKNATNSLENGVYIESAEISKRFYQEWKQLIMVSEPLDWSSEYSEPELEINTMELIT